MNNQLNTVYSDIRRTNDSASSSASFRAATAGAVRVTGNSGLTNDNMHQDTSNHSVFDDDENPANDELGNLSEDVLRNHNGMRRAPRETRMTDNSDGPVALMNYQDKMQFAMRASKANIPGAVHHTPGQAPARAKPAQFSLFTRFRRNPKEAHRGPSRHHQDDGERMRGFAGTRNAVEQEPLDEMQSRMNSFQRQSDNMEEMAEQTKQRRKRYLLVGVVGLLVVVGVVAGVAVGMVSNSNKQQDTSPSTTTGSAPGAEDDLTDFVETVADCLEAPDYEVSQRFTRLQSIVVSDFTGIKEAIDTPGTPARAALCWVADVDSFDVDTTEEKSVVTQRFALGLIYFHFVLNLDSESDSKLPTSNWLHAVHECGWDYVDCDEESVVVGLRMAQLQLEGTIPSELGLLKKLSTLQIDDNYLVGTIPSEIWTKESLVALRVGHNMLSGTISSNIRNLPQLQVFSAPNSRLTGTIPDLRDLSKLETLILASDGLTGTLPNLQGTTNLEVMQLISLFLSGTIPSYLGSLTKLTFLSISDIALVGTIPTEIGMLTELRKLELDRLKKVSGSIPTELGQLSQLTHLDLSKMFQLSGTVPSEIGLLTNLDLSDAEGLTGSIPPEVCNLRSQWSTDLFEVCGLSCETKCPVL